MVQAVRVELVGLHEQRSACALEVRRRLHLGIDVVDQVLPVRQLVFLLDVHPLQQRPVAHNFRDRRLVRSHSCSV